jgi:hypothetical protein
MIRLQADGLIHLAIGVPPKIDEAALRGARDAALLPAAS